MTSAARLVLCSAALLTLGAAPSPGKGTPYSLVIGDLSRQKDAPGSPCEPDEDLCMDVMLETRLWNVEVLAGNETNSRLRVWHRAHTPYRWGARMQLAMIVGPSSKGIRRGINLGTPTNGRVCVDESWFLPNPEGMRIPRGHSVNEDGDVCFTV
ncbi:MAG TPA: hypothetical protein VFV30_00980 [Novosphingobium sp.]|nr:hypothetical protein [Novosphingobium sp.]